MRFIDFQIREVLDHSALKLAVAALSFLTLIFGLLLSLDLTKSPIVVERACETKLLQTQSSSQTSSEIESFLNVSLRSRFDSNAEVNASAYLEPELLNARTKEQSDLKRSGIDQRLIIRNIVADKLGYLIDADRIIAIGFARSAIPLKIRAKFSSGPRTLSNPYGLMLTSVEQIKEEK